MYRRLTLENVSVHKYPKRSSSKLKLITDTKPLRSEKYLYVSLDEDPMTDKVLPILKLEYRQKMQKDEFLTDFDRLVYGKSPENTFKQALRQSKSPMKFVKPDGIEDVHNALLQLEKRRKSFANKYNKLFGYSSCSETENRKFPSMRDELAKVKLPNNSVQEKSYFKQVSSILDNIN